VGAQAKALVGRAVSIVRKAPPDERAKLAAYFALLFWNLDGFSANDFHAHCA